MSDIHLIKGSIDKLKENLPAILMKHEDEISLAPERLSLSGKRLEDALKDQGAYPIVYASIKAELDAICKYIDSQLDKKRAQLTKHWIDNYQRELSDRTRNTFVEGDDEYLSYYHLYVEVKELHEKAGAVVDAFQTRGFALRDITSLRVNSMHTTVL